MQAIGSYILQAIGDGQMGSVALGKALEFDRASKFELPLILQARLYQSSGDYKSAREYWHRILGKNQMSLQANAGLAQIAFIEGNRDEFIQYGSRAYKISPDYIPIRSLVMQARRRGWNI